MALKTSDLWTLTWGTPEVDPSDLAHAMVEEASRAELDYRTRLLIRDSVEALRSFWGQERLALWLAGSPAQEQIEAICREDFEKAGFPTIRERLVEKTDPEVVRQLLRDLGLKIHKSLRLAIGGSIALIMPGYLSRAAADIDVVNELPEELRNQHQLLDELRQRYGLLLAHFQSRYLPSGWDKRLHYLDTFGNLQVYLVDVYDVFLSKLYSARTKDLDDIRLLLPSLEKSVLVERFKETAEPFLAAPRLKELATNNWYILFGETLPQ